MKAQIDYNVRQHLEGATEKEIAEYANLHLEVAQNRLDEFLASPAWPEMTKTTFGGTKLEAVEVLVWSGTELLTIRLDDDGKCPVYTTVGLIGFLEADEDEIKDALDSVYEQFMNCIKKRVR